MFTNPISQAERLHQRRSSNLPTLKVLSVLTLGLVLMLFAVHPDTEGGGQIVLLALIAIHALHFIILFLAVTVAFESIYRERQAQSWDLLLLTPLRRTTLLWGKLWAVLGRLTPLYLRLIGLKLIFLIWQFTQIRSLTNPSTTDFQEQEFLVLAAMTLLFIVVYLLLDMLFTAALGLVIALVIPLSWRRLGLAGGLLVRWWLPLLTLTALIIYTELGHDPLPTHWNSHVSLAARYTVHIGFDYVGYWGMVAEVFPALAITVPDGPLLVIMHTTVSSDIETTDVFGLVLLGSLGAYLGLALAVIGAGWGAIRLRRT